MKIAITGGIGSGKSYVCKRLNAIGIEVYDCDAAAKRLMRTSTELQHQLQELIGEEVFEEGVLQKAVMARFLLESEENNQAINDIVHPAVARDFENSGLEWIESAILFDSGFINRIYIDKVVCVTAPEEVRVERIVARDSISSEKALEWIHRQLPQEAVLHRSDYEIVNDGKHDIDEQISRLLLQIRD